jgi:DNA-binding NarL/FixJ family response regulator
MGFADSPTDKQQKRLLLADDHEMLLEVFSLFLQGASQVEVTTAKSFDEAAAHIQRTGPFDVTLLDWNMPGMHGIVGLKRAIQLSQGKPVAIITGEATPKIIDEVVVAGAAGIVLKSSGARSLVNALNMILSGERYLPFDLLMKRKSQVATEGTDELTPREMLILSEIAKGKRNKEICADLQLALPTVKMHVSALCRKLGAKNRLHATVLARDLGLI